MGERNCAGTKDFGLALLKSALAGCGCQKRRLTQKDQFGSECSLDPASNGRGQSFNEKGRDNATDNDRAIVELKLGLGDNPSTAQKRLV